MNQLTKVFEQQDLTIIEVEGDFHFLLKDVCEILEIGNHRHVKTRLEEDVVSNYPLQTAGGKQQATFVNEDGLYDVILDSRKPEAKRFRKWITSEVLPSIRKTGGYQVQPTSQAELIAMIAQNNLEHEKRLLDVEEKTIEQGKKLDNIKDILSLNMNDWRNESNKIINAIATKLGGGQYFKDVRKESYDLLEERAKCKLNVRLTNRKNAMAGRGMSKTNISKLSKLDIIGEDKKLISVYITVIKELAVKYQLNLSDYQLALSDAQ